MADLAAQLHALADRLDSLAHEEVIGTLETIKSRVQCEMVCARLTAVAPSAPGAGAALDVDEVVKRTGMSKAWLYRTARSGQLPFARRIGRRIRFDELGLARWLEKRRAR